MYRNQRDEITLIDSGEVDLSWSVVADYQDAYGRNGAELVRKLSESEAPVTLSVSQSRIVISSFRKAISEGDEWPPSVQEDLVNALGSISLGW